MTAQGKQVGRAAERLARTEIDYGFEDRLLPIDAVIAMSGIGRTMVYRKMKAGTFPQACKPGGVSSRWSEAEVKAWVAEQLAARAA
jgi:prophage regulatory protein